MDGLNQFNVVYYINLDHRKDRLESIQEQLKKTNIANDKIVRIPGVYDKDFGPLGCAKSHVLALETFIQSGKETCILLEDDFVFTQEQPDIFSWINIFFSSEYASSYDVLMLSANIIHSQPVSDCDVITKITEAQTASGYSVRKHFAPILLENLQESVRLLEQHGTEFTKQNGMFYNDQYWKKLQPMNQWYCLQPKIGKQMCSYSDNIYTVTDYEC